jgi:hypothetical protein
MTTISRIVQIIDCLRVWLAFAVWQAISLAKRQAPAKVGYWFTSFVMVKRNGLEAAGTPGGPTSH